MRTTLTLVLTGLCFTAAAQTLAPQSKVFITHVTVIDTETGKEEADQTVVMSDGKISDVAKSRNLAAPTSARIVDGRGKYLIPGLWDMHVHGTRFDSTLPLYIANGVTGVREMFGPPDANEFRAELAAKHLIAPHIYLASPIVDGKPPVWPDSIVVGTADEARRVVDEQKRRGADFIKVYSLLSRDAYFAILDEARQQNIPVGGHVPNSVTLLEAAAAKQRSIEHLIGIELACSNREKDLRPKIQAASPIGIEFDKLVLAALQSSSDSRCKGVFAELRKNGSWPVPTLAVWRSVGRLNDSQFTSDNRVRYFSGEFRDWMTGKLDARMKEWSASEFAVRRDIFSAESKLTGELFRAGVPLLAGTDVGNAFCFPGFSLHDELALLVESGLTPLAALQAATRNAAIFMNATDRYGSVSKGKIADLVLLDADPLQDIHNTIKISEVFLDGKEFDRVALDGTLGAAEAEASASDQLHARIAPHNEMQQLSHVFAGRWSGKITSDPGSRQEGTADEIWRLSPGQLTLVEENHMNTAKGDSYDYAALWWNPKAHKYEGIWCAEINDEGCSRFDATLKDNQVEMTGEWEQKGHRRTWREVFARPDQSSSIQTLDIGEPGAELKRASAIRASKIAEGSTDFSNTPAEAELRAFMAKLRQASIEGDVDAIANSMTDDYVQTDINGYRQDKTTWLNEYFRPLADLIKAAKFRWDEYERTNLQFRFYGDCAVVTGELHAKGTGARFGAQHTWVPDPNASFSGTLHFTHVYIRQNGKWMLAALHNQIPPAPARAAN
jgi:imidazolonepropionase-like amidohydrolase/ketosteroid isomerase-like protein